MGPLTGFTIVELAGIDPFPGTVNLILDDDGHRDRWRRWRRSA